MSIFLFPFSEKPLSALVPLDCLCFWARIDSASLFKWKAARVGWKDGAVECLLLERKLGALDSCVLPDTRPNTHPS